ncbi:thiamine phosphate synthase [Xylanimonas protaetiae]|uniref:Thiamine-phosphate synthase n=1 Tax=Xylanimonas protaetiae TaxID=2509457 RepID=A0A4P6F5D4_9MICO|nr:thiamine phosphate synthase [Xylanimonas protaetiae]QAY70565.1 thiamine phosphate synthase [Xylanimonas protaetiae]
MSADLAAAAVRPGASPAGPGVRGAFDPAVYLVTDTVRCGGPAGVLDTVRAALAGGVTAVQLRDPGASTRELAALGEALLAVLRPAGVPLVVDDRVDVALAIGADGAHVGQHDLDPVAARRLLGPGRHLGLSVTTPAEAVAAAALPAGTLDLLGVGPVHATTSKADARPAIGLDGLAAVAAAARAAGAPPCVAIGGLRAVDVPALRAAGAVGSAVVSAVCGTPDPRAATAALAHAWRAR